MAMKPQCATAVRAAAGGRPISEAKLQAIEDAISSQMRELARRDRQRWQGLTRDQRVAEATAKAMEDIQAEAALKEYRASLQVLRTAESDARITEQMHLVGVTRSQGLIHDIENTGDYVHAVRNEAMSGLSDMIDAAESRDGTGALRNLGMRIFDLDNPRMTADVVREVFANADGSTGNKAAQAGARAWLDVIEKMRQRFNAAGGAIGKLGYGYLSQAHDAVRVLDAGADAWAKKVLPLLDREQYVRPDGSLMGNAELTDMPLLRCTTIEQPLKLKSEYVGYTLTIERGLGGGSNIVVGECSVNKVRADCKDGGTVDLTFRVQASKLQEAVIGKLATLIGCETSITLTPPAVKQAPTDGTETFVEQHGGKVA